VFDEEHPDNAYLYFFEPPSRPDKILLRRVGYADILPGRQVSLHGVSVSFPRQKEALTAEAPQLNTPKGSPV